MIKKILLFVTSSLIVQNSSAFNLFDGRMRAYECMNEREARSCTKCKSVKSLILEFKVNSETSSVLQQGYEGKELFTSNTFKKCKIVDKKNWECGDGRVNKGALSNSSTLYTNDFQGMNNGIFYSFYESHVYRYDEKGGVKITPTTVSYTCAK